MVLVHLHVHDACPCPCCTSMFLSMFSTVHHRSVCMCQCVFVCVFVRINAGLSGIRSVRYRNEKTNDAVNGPVPQQVKAVRHFFGPVPDWKNLCRNADAGVSFLDADAQLWSDKTILFLRDLGGLSLLYFDVWGEKLSLFNQKINLSTNLDFMLTFCLRQPQRGETRNSKGVLSTGEYDLNLFADLSLLENRCIRPELVC